MPLIIGKDYPRKCYLCGDERSVNYTIEVVDPEIEKKPRRVSICDRCALFYGIGTNIKRIES